jgi:hypothetical protein
MTHRNTFFCCDFVYRWGRDLPVRAIWSRDEREKNVSSKDEEEHRIPAARCLLRTGP